VSRVSAVREKVLRLLETLPDDVLEELIDDIEDMVALLVAEREDDGTRIPWDDAKKRLGLASD